jgi:hypothetical protein
MTTHKKRVNYCKYRPAQNDCYFKHSHEKKNKQKVRQWQTLLKAKMKIKVTLKQSG